MPRAPTRWRPWKATRLSCCWPSTASPGAAFLVTPASRRRSTDLPRVPPEHPSPGFIPMVRSHERRGWAAFTTRPSWCWLSPEMSTPAWSAQQLAEFLAAVSSAQTEALAALAAVEGVAEAFDAEVAAIVRGRELVAAVGYPEDYAPMAELESTATAAPDCQVPVPGMGMCPAKAVPLGDPPGGMLVVGRSGPGGLSRVEESLLRGMARATSLTMQKLRLLDDERAARENVERLAREQ